EERLEGGRLGDGVGGSGERVVQGRSAGQRVDQASTLGFFRGVVLLAVIAVATVVVVGVRLVRRGRAAGGGRTPGVGDELRRVRRDQHPDVGLGQVHRVGLGFVVRLEQAEGGQGQYHVTGTLVPEQVVAVVPHPSCPHVLIVTAVDDLAIALVAEVAPD